MSAATTPSLSLTVLELYDLLSVCCCHPPLVGSSYPPCDSNAPRSGRVPHRSGPPRQSWASAARAKPGPSVDLGSVRAASVKCSVGFIGKFRSGPADADPAWFIVWHVKHLFTKRVCPSRAGWRAGRWDQPRARATAWLARLAPTK